MKRWLIVLGVALTVGVCANALAQGGPDFSGTWTFNQGKSSPGTAGNSPDLTFPTEITVKQTPTELHVASSTVRQKPVTAIYKLDGTKVAVQMPSGISETGEAKFDGPNIVITSRRSFSSPAGDIVVEFKDIWSINGNVLTIQKTRTSEGDSTTAKGIFDKK
jgi:hypothetical protein